jgi:V/A-type H+-transporting ATPase subunit C
LEITDSDPKLTDLEIALEKSIAAQRLLAFHRSTLSVGVIIGFLLLKEEEMSNLRKIAKSKEFHVPEAEVRKMLVVV